MSRPEQAVSHQSRPSGTTNNSVPTGTNQRAIPTAGNLGAVTANPADNTNMSATSTPEATDDAQVSTSSPATVNLLAVAPGDPPHMVKFKTTISTVLVNPDFTGDVKKVEKVTQAATLPNPEDRVRAQLLSHAEKTLYAKSAKDAERGLPFVLPTRAAINAQVELGVKAWKEKQAQ